HRKIRQVEEEIKYLRQQLHQTKLPDHPSPPSPPSPSLCKAAPSSTPPQLLPHHPSSPCPSSPPHSPSLTEAATPGASGAALQDEMSIICNQFIMEVIQKFENKS
ncbi:hypothetical protein GBAR_LOCUS15114, partial [Geodia barretti]